MRNVVRNARFSGLFLLAGVHVASAGQAVSIAINDLEYGPASVAVHVGDTVTWINKDLVDHRATARDGAFDLKTLKGKPARWRARKIGEFAYYCRLHPNMTGVIRVTR
jgi:plastocyanin